LLLHQIHQNPPGFVADCLADLSMMPSNKAAHGFAVVSVAGEANGVLG
jgi:hypothetical protein